MELADLLIKDIARGAKRNRSNTDMDAYAILASLLCFYIALLVRQGQFVLYDLLATITNAKISK